MRLKMLGSGLLVALSLALFSAVGAQSPSIEWKAWNAQITAHANNSQLEIAETQIINVTDGQLHSGERSYSQPVNIQSVYLATNGGSPQQLSQGNGPGMYQVSNSNGEVVLDYQLPQTANAGDSFAVQINYTVNAATTGLIDWFAVPADHPFPVDSSTVTINFPEGGAPSADFARMPQGNGTVSASGNSITIQSQGAIPANQSFEVQLPYGSGVGQAGNTSSTGNTTNPIQTVPTGTTGDSTGLGSILPILCILGVVLLIGGGRGLLGGLLGGLGGSLLGGNRSGGIFGGSTPIQPNDPFSGNEPSRGFRESPNQNREIPPIQSDKRGGGGARFK